jgi:hypothetical protein
MSWRLNPSLKAYLISLESLHQSSLNIVCISCHIKLSQCSTSQIPPISTTNSKASQFVAVIPQYYLNAWVGSHEAWHVYHDFWGHLDGVLNKSLSSIVPTLQSLKLSYQILSLYWKESKRLVFPRFFF